MGERAFSRRGLFLGLLRETSQEIREARRENEPNVFPEVPQVVKLQVAACIAFRGTTCTVCSERCPEPGAIVTNMGRPTIVEANCTGCGECVTRCPAPIRTLRLEPAVDGLRAT